METAVAETVARGTREQSQQDARADLKELRRLAVEAGRERSRKIIKTSRIDTRTGVIRYNPSGRLLRDWYRHAYLNSLRANLGEPAVHIDAQQVEDTTAQLRRIQAGPEPVRALQAVATIRDVAIDDAAHAAAEIVSRLRTTGIRRAVLHAGDDRFEGDQIRIHVNRHWYQRCYDDHVEAATRSQQPLAGVTDAEERQVAAALETRTIRRLIGRDGIPLVTAHNTRLNDIDRRLAVGETGVIPAVTGQTNHGEFENLRKRVTRTWAALPDSERTQWLRLAGANDHIESSGWSRLGGDQQGKVIRYYLETHRRELLDEAFERSSISADPEVAAKRMFNHGAVLLRTPADRDHTVAERTGFGLSSDSEAVTSSIGTAPSHSARHA